MMRRRKLTPPAPTNAPATASRVIATRDDDIPYCAHIIQLCVSRFANVWLLLTAMFFLNAAFFFQYWGLPMKLLLQLSAPILVVDISIVVASKRIHRLSDWNIVLFFSVLQLLLFAFILGTLTCIGQFVTSTPQKHRVVMGGYLSVLFCSTNFGSVPPKIYIFVLIPLWATMWCLSHYFVLDFFGPPIIVYGCVTSVFVACSYTVIYAQSCTLWRTMKELDAERKLLLSTQAALHGMLVSLFDASGVCSGSGRLHQCTSQLQSLLGGGDICGCDLQSFTTSVAEEVRLHAFLHHAAENAIDRAAVMQTSFRSGCSGAENANLERIVKLEATIYAIVLPEGSAYGSSAGFTRSVEHSTETDGRSLFVGLQVQAESDSIPANADRQSSPNEPTEKEEQHFHTDSHEDRMYESPRFLDELNLLNQDKLLDESGDISKEPFFDAWSGSEADRCGTYNVTLPQESLLGETLLELNEVDDAISVITTTPTEAPFSQLECMRLSHTKEADGKLQQLLERILECGLREHWLIKATDVRLHPNCILGAGSYGVVVAASLHGTPAVVKIPRSARIGTHMRRLPSLVGELRILRRLRHPHVAHLYGACIEPASGELFLILQRVNGPTLSDFFDARKGAWLHCTAKVAMLMDICCALRYLHAQSPCIVHGDVKGSNVLVEMMAERPQCKLIDFGLSRSNTRNARPLGGTLRWMAPEVISQQTVAAPSADVFSFGRLMFLVQTGLEPLQKMDGATIRRLAMRGSVPELSWPSVPASDDSQEEAVNSKVQILSNLCLQFEKDTRPRMVAVHTELATFVVCGGGKTPVRSHVDDSTEAPTDTSLLPFMSGPMVELKTGVQQVRSSLQHMAQGAVETNKSVMVASDVQAPEIFISSLEGAAPLTSAQGASPGKLLPTVHEDTEPKLARAGLKPTESRCKGAMVMDMVQHWNFVLPAGSCCCWHACLRELRLAERTLRATPCATGFKVNQGQQCKGCGALQAKDDDDEEGGELPPQFECSVCGFGCTDDGIEDTP